MKTGFLPVRLLMLFSRAAMMMLNCCFGRGQCCACGTFTARGVLCRSCTEEKLYGAAREAARSPRCDVCGKMLLGEEKTCMSCRTGRILLSTYKSVPVLPYRIWLKTLLFEWKMNGQRSLSPVFARLCDIAIRSHFSGSFAIVPVPPRPGKIKRLGWDQIDELSEMLRRTYRYRVLKLLERTTGLQQKKLSRTGRLESKGRGYAVSRLCLRLSAEGALPSHVILIDDVLTTGVTAESCARLLKDAGVSKVAVLTLFIVD